jgi:hypothetical protein
VVRVLGLCFSFALVCLAVAGLATGVPRWEVVLAFAAGGVGVLLDAILWVRRGRGSILVSLAMSIGLFVFFIVGVAAHASSWLIWCVLFFACAFLVLGAARAGQEMWGEPPFGELF